MINYQGRLVIGVSNFTGTTSFKFALVDGITGVSHWSHDGTSVNGSEPATGIGLEVNKGLYSILLGDTGIPGMDALPPGVFTNSDVRLRVWVYPLTVSFDYELLQPDRRIAAVGYAMMAADVEDETITGAKIADGTLTDDDISTSANISDSKLAVIVTPGKVADSALSDNVSRLGPTVESSEVADGQLSADDLDVPSFSNTFWKLDGNAGVEAGTHFLGSLNNAPLDFRVQDQRVLRLQPSEWLGLFSPNIIAGHSANACAEGVVGASIGGGGSFFMGTDGRHWIGGNFGTIGGGDHNQALGIASTVAGGQHNIASGDNSSVGGGSENAAGGIWSTVGGGWQNQAGADSATVPGGKYNSALGPYSLAAGRRAKALNQGSFVWADSTDADFASTAPNQFLIRAGGVGIGTNLTPEKLTVAGNIKANSFIGSGAGLTSISGASIAAGTISNQHLAAGSVTSTTLADGAVGQTDLASGAVTANALGDDTVQSQHLADQSVTLASLAGAAYSLGFTVITNPPGGLSDDLFGQAVAAGGGKLLVGAPSRDAIGAGNCGAAFLYDQNGSLLAVITNGTPQPDFRLGFSAAINDDGLLILGAPGGFSGRGSVLVFEPNNLEWPTWYDGLDPWSLLGAQVAPAGPGRFLASGLVEVGPPLMVERRARLFNVTIHPGFPADIIPSVTFSNPAPTAMDDGFSKQMAMLGTEKVLICAPANSVAADAAGVVYIFSTNGTLLHTVFRPAPAAGDHFGSSLAAIGDDRFAVGAPGAGQAWIVKADGTPELWIDAPAGAADFADGLSLLDANTLLIHAREAASTNHLVFLYRTDGTLLGSVPGPAQAFTALERPLQTPDPLHIAVGSPEGTENRIALISLGRFVEGLMAQTVADNAITAAKIADGTISDAEIGSSASIADTKLATITTPGKVADSALSANVSMLGGAVESAEITDGTITPDDLDLSGFEGTFWKLAGNVGTTAGIHFLGTADSQPLEIRAANYPLLRLSYGGISPNLVGGLSENSVADGLAGVVIAGGGSPDYPNTALDSYTVIGGGRSNRVGRSSGIFEDGAYAIVGGGYGNVAEGYFSAVSGGRVNLAAGYCSLVAGGEENSATGSFSFAAGRRARANHPGCFVWADTNYLDFASTAPNEFSARAQGGVRFVSGIDVSGAVTSGVQLAAGSGSWSSLSDRNTKANFVEVDAREILDRLRSLPIDSWNYRTQDPSIRHIGPVSQDFQEAFGFGEDGLHISTVDAQGIALAAVQGLYEIVLEKESQIESMDREIQELRNLLLHREPAP